MKCRDGMTSELMECMREHTWILRQRVRRLNQKRRRETLKKQNLGLTPQDRQVTCFIFEVSASMTAAVLWVVNKIPATLKDMPSRSDIEKVIGQWTATTSASMRLAWEDPLTPTQCKVRQRAHEFIAEANLFAWVTRQNAKGVAPSSRLMVMQLNQDWPWNATHHVHHLPNTLLSGTEFWKRQWAKRFRDRWGMKIGRLPLAPEIFPLEITKTRR